MNTSKQRPIICATDFSESAQRAAIVAASLARRLHAPLTLVHGLDETGVLPSQYCPSLADESRHDLAAEQKRLLGFGFEADTALAGSVLHEGVSRWTEQTEGLLLVVGCAGKGALHRMVLGSISERIAESSAVPTLVIRDGQPLEAWARGEHRLRVFVAVDFTPVSDSALRWLEEFRLAGNCHITVGYVDRSAGECAEFAIFDALGVSTETPESAAKLERDLREKCSHWLGTTPDEVCIVPGSSSVDAHLLQIAKEARAELIVIGTHQRHGLSRVGHLSVSRRILREAHTDLVCVPTRLVQAGTKAKTPIVRRVLAATNLSSSGDRAILHAYSLVPEGGEVSLLHVLQPGEEREAVLSRLQGLIPEEAAERGVATNLEVLRQEDTAAQICDTADRRDADLVCIGSHGEGGALSSALMGSIAHRVIARSNRPVLVVRQPRL